MAIMIKSSAGFEKIVSHNRAASSSGLADSGNMCPVMLPVGRSGVRNPPPPPQKIWLRHSMRPV